MWEAHVAVDRFALPGSQRTIPADVRVIGSPNLHELIEVTVVLRRRKPLTVREDREPLSREQFAVEYGSDPADVARLEAFAQQYDLTVGGVDLARRSVVLSGTIAAMDEAFGTSLRVCQSDRGTYRVRAGELYLPVDLHGLVDGVFGLDNRPQAQVRCRRKWTVVGPRAAGDVSYTP